MITKILTLTNLDLFVWLSFAVTFILCGAVYFNTKKTLDKYKKDFAAELAKLSEADRQMVLKKSKIANQILLSQNKTV
jgi:hypothetical protein